MINKETRIGSREIIFIIWLFSDGETVKVKIYCLEVLREDLTLIL